MIKANKTQQLFLHWLPLFQWSLDINFKPLAAPLRPISKTWPNKPSLLLQHVHLFYPPAFHSLHFSLSDSIADGGTLLKCFGLFWGADNWFIHYEHSQCFATVGMIRSVPAYGLKAWHIDVYLPHKLQMWTQWLDVFRRNGWELNWKPSQSQTNSLSSNSQWTKRWLLVWTPCSYSGFSYTFITHHHCSITAYILPLFTDFTLTQTTAVSGQ